MRIEDCNGSRGQRLPKTTRDFALQLPGGPARVAGVDAEAFRAVPLHCKLVLACNYAKERRRLGPDQSANTEGDWPSRVNHRSGSSPWQDVGNRNGCGLIEHQPHRGFGIILDEKNDATRKIRVLRFRSRHQHHPSRQIRALRTNPQGDHPSCQPPNPQSPTPGATPEAWRQTGIPRRAPSANASAASDRLRCSAAAAR